MTEVLNSQNLNAHYSTNTKVQRPERPVAFAPASIPQPHLFDDKDANNRLKAINQDIYFDSKKEEKKPVLKFLKFFGILVGSILAIKGIRTLFK